MLQYCLCTSPWIWALFSLSLCAFPPPPLRTRPPLCVYRWAEFAHHLSHEAQPLGAPLGPFDPFCLSAVARSFDDTFRTEDSISDGPRGNGRGGELQLEADDEDEHEDGVSAHHGENELVLTGLFSFLEVLWSGRPRQGGSTRVSR